MQTAATFWDNAAEKYAKSAIRDPDAYHLTLNRTRAHLKPTDHALELGAGTGGTARLLAPDLAHITATDIAPAMIEIAKQRAADEGTKNASFITADLEGNLPDGGPYDVALAFNLLHLLPDLDSALAHVHDLVKPDGLFISKTICLAQPGLGLKFRLMLMAIPVMQWIGKAPYVRKLTIPQLERTIEAAGFDIIETANYPANPPSRFIVARRR